MRTGAQRAVGWCETVQVLYGITLEQAAEPERSKLSPVSYRYQSMHC